MATMVNQLDTNVIQNNKEITEVSFNCKICDKKYNNRQALWKRSRYI